MNVQRRPKDSHFDLLTVADCAQVFSDYELGDVLSIESLIVANGYIVNLLERSETSRKSAVYTTEGAYFLKQVPWYCARSGLVGFSSTFSNACSKAGIPAPRVYDTRRHKPCTEHRGCLFTVSDLVVGGLYRGEDRQILSSGSVLARMHSLGRSFDQNIWGPQADTMTIVEDHIELASRIANEHGLRSDVFEALGKMRDSLAQPHYLRKYPVHGDFIPWNLAFGDDGDVVAIYDFDNASWDSRLHDVGEAIVAWAALDFSGSHAGLNPQIRCRIDREVSAKFLESYQNILPLEDDECRALPSFVLGAWWEAVLLGYVKGEVPLTELDKLPELSFEVERWEKDVL